MQGVRYRAGGATHPLAGDALAQRHDPLDHLRAQAAEAQGLRRRRLRALSRDEHVSFVVVGESLVDIVVPADGGAAPRRRRRLLPQRRGRAGPARRADHAGHPVGDDELRRAGASSTSRASGVTARRGLGRPRRYDEHRDRPPRRAARRDVRLRPRLGPARPGPARRRRSACTSARSARPCSPGRDAVVDLVRQAADARRVRQLRPEHPAGLPRRPRGRLGATCSRSPRLPGWSSSPTRTCGCCARTPPRRTSAASCWPATDTELVVAHPRRRSGATGVHRGRDARRCPRRRPTWSTPSAPATRSWPRCSRCSCDWGVVGRRRGRAARARRRPGASCWCSGAATAAAVTCSRRGANPPTRRELPTNLAGRLSAARPAGRGARPALGHDVEHDRVERHPEVAGGAPRRSWPAGPGSCASRRCRRAGRTPR